jgi:hypothetical protein
MSEKGYDLHVENADICIRDRLPTCYDANINWSLGLHDKKRQLETWISDKTAGWGPAATVASAPETPAQLSKVTAVVSAPKKEIPKVPVAEDPEECVATALKASGHAAGNIAALRYACVRKYIQLVEPGAVRVEETRVRNPTLAWFPQMQAFPNSIPPHVTLTIKNDSALRVIGAAVILMEKKTKATQTYRLIADAPIDPYRVGTLSGDVLLDDSSKEPAKFWPNHDWALIQVTGVPLPTQ